MVVAGEASADRYAARVVEVLRSRCPDVEAFGIGGPALERAGLECRADFRVLEIIGFSAVVARLPRLLRLYRQLSRWLRERRPHVLLCVDLPDFNARLARRARRLGIPVLFYVAPQVWAWRSGRAKRWRDLPSRLVVTLPFELPLWQRNGLRVAYHGHPLLEELPARIPERRAAYTELGLNPERRTLVLAPGSRASEWKHHADPLFGAAARVLVEHPDLQLAVPLAPGIDADLANDAAERAGIEVICTRAPHHALLSHADLGLICSGTLTLEAALAGLPMLVFYRTGWANALIARLLLETDRIALPNLLLGGPTPVFPELLQQAASADGLAAETLRLLADDAARAQLREATAQVRARLSPGRPSLAVAETILALASEVPARDGPAKHAAR